MAFVNENGLVPLQYDNGVNENGISAHSSSGIATASGTKIAFVGSVWHPTVKTGTINIRKVHFRCGALTLNTAGGTEVRVSLQNVSGSAGPPYQPDGTQDQTYDFKTATTTLTQNAWNTTGNLSADRAVDLSATNLSDSNSRWQAVVWEFNVFNTSDSLVISTCTNATTAPWNLGGILLLNTGSYAATASRQANVVLECDDGTFAFLQNGAFFSAFSNVSVSSTGAIRRAGLKFKVPTTRKLDRAGLIFLVPNGCDGTVKLYDTDGTTVLASVEIDNDAVQSAATAIPSEVVFQPVTLTANSFYRLAFVGGTATAATVYYGDVNAAGHMDGGLLGQNAHWTQHDGSNWADTTTRRPHFALGFSAFDDASGGGVSRSRIQSGF